MTFRPLSPEEIKANQFPDGPHLTKDLRSLNLVFLEKLTGRPIAELKQTIGIEGEFGQSIHS